MKTPTFWKHKSIVSYLLLPIGWLYGFITSLRVKLKNPYKAKVPVICIGNITAGGTGKTPVSIAVAEILKQNYKNVFFVSRGYGGTLKNVIADEKIHTPYQIGDEPLLLSKVAPVSINSDRGLAAQLAISNGADCLIMDDGFQNPSLYKDISFLVFNGSFGIGNGCTIPAGPLRETFNSGIKRANAIIIIGEDKTKIANKTDLPVFYADIQEENPDIKNKNVFAFAGIGYPEKLYQSLQKCGLNVVKTKDFPDHHFYTKEELQEIINIAKEENLEIFTTSKDFVKIPYELKEHFNVLNIKIKWQDENQLKKFLKNNL